MPTSTVYPQVRVEKSAIPTIYLDTCIMVELARHEQGLCKDTHKRDIADLYDVLSAMRHNKKILIPMGNQLEEMGMTKNRENAKQFLYRFTNCELLHPDLVLNAEMKAGYEAFENNTSIINLGVATAFKPERHAACPVAVRVAPQYSPERAEIFRNEKMEIVRILNDIKLTKKVQPTFEGQLNKELEAEFQMAVNAFEAPLASEASFSRYADEVGKFYRITGAPPTEDAVLHGKTMSRYLFYLLSPYHHIIPYIWLRANLWTHLMIRPNNIVRGDNLDVKWAAAYLPFVNYAVTDHSFCELLKTSGLAELYGTKIYSFRSLTELLEELT